MQSLRVYSSSAGSGKTYTLTKEYISILIDNPKQYKNILAVTFTNKATAEMKHRIVEYLHKLAVGKAGELAAEIARIKEKDIGFVQHRASLALRFILHDYSHFSVSTIDSFFQRVIRAFAKELGEPVAYQLELDQDMIMDELVEELIQELPENTRLRNWISRFAEEKIEEGKAWKRIGSLIAEQGKEIFREYFRELAEDMQKHEDESFLVNYQRSLLETTSAIESTMRTYGKKAAEILDRFNLEAEDLAGASRSPAVYLCALQHEIYERFSLKTTLLSTLEGKPWYSAKSPRAADIQAAVDTGLQELLEDVVEFWQSNSVRYFTAKAVLKNFYTYGLLAMLSRKLQVYCKENDIMLLSNAGQLLKRVIDDSDMPFIYEKTGTRYMHYMLDEFQDTSALQWENFHPLIGNSDGHCIVVGDTKQAIYRWRNGDWKLLNKGIGEKFPGHEKLNLDTNWRSRKNIVDFNNYIFRDAPEHIRAMLAQDLDKSMHGEGTELHDISEAYTDSFQQTPESAKPDGLVNFTFFDHRRNNYGTPPDKEDKLHWKDKALQRIPRLVESLQDQSYALKDIAFLVRRNGEGIEITESLLEYRIKNARDGYRYDVISNEALLLKNSVSVRILISALRYFQKPQDAVVKATLVSEYHLYVKNNTGRLHNMYASCGDTSIPAAFLPEEFTREYSRLRSLPLYSLVESIIRIFELNSQRQKGEFAYLQAFCDEVLRQSIKENASISSFLTWWEIHGSNKAIRVSEQQDAMRIYTIHKAKGLQNKVIIIPFCSWDLDQRTNSTTWMGSDVEPFNQLSKLPVNYINKLAETFFSKDYHEEKIQAHLDNLNLLYVALTRAENALYGFAPVDFSKENLKTAGDLMYKLVSSPSIETGLSMIQREIKEIEDEKHFSFGALPAGERKDAPRRELDVYLSYSLKKKKLPRVAGKTVTLISDEIYLGLQLHDILSKINSKDELIKAISSVEELRLERPHLAESLRKRIQSFLQLEQVNEWYGGGWEYKNERSILLPDGSRYRADRLLIKGHEAIVLDFKTGLEEAAHIRQVEQYMTILKEMNFTKVKGYLLYISDEKTQVKEVMEEPKR